MRFQRDSVRLYAISEVRMYYNEILFKTVKFLNFFLVNNSRATSLPVSFPDKSGACSRETESKWRIGILTSIVPYFNAAAAPLLGEQCLS